MTIILIASALMFVSSIAALYNELEKPYAVSILILIYGAGMIGWLLTFIFICGMLVGRN